MGLRINTNEMALTAQHHLENTSNQLDSTLQRLATGSRIVHASDDAAGLAISENLNAQARSLGQAIRNAQDGISLIQVYEGGANELSNTLIRLRELAMSAATDTVGDSERGLIDAEVQQLVQEVSRIARTTKFGGRELLSGEHINLEFQVGANNNPEVDRIHFSPGDTNLTADGLGITGLNVANLDDAREALDSLDGAINRVSAVRAKVGATQSRLNTTVQAQQIFEENILAAKSRIRDADVAVETANLTKQTILRKAGAAVLAQANEAPAVALQLLKG